MFHRRTPSSPLRRITDVIWPRLGWLRFFTYLWHRLARLPGSPHSIAAGLAAGAAMSFTPLLGAHFVLSALLAAIARGNILAAVVGTVLGNPWTFPFIWAASFQLGQWMLPASWFAKQTGNQDFIGLFARLTQAVLGRDPSMLVDRVLPIWVPMMVGSIPLAIAAWLVTYQLSRRSIERYQRLRLQRRRRRAGRSRRLPTASLSSAD